MAWEYNKGEIKGVRKVVWDGLWHVLYCETYDRVSKKDAMYVLRNMQKWRDNKNKS